MPTLHCSIVTPEKALYEGDADAVIVPGIDGEIGVWPSHAAFLGALGAGELRLIAKGSVQRYFVGGGFVQVRDNVVNVVTDEAVAASNIDRDQARKALADLEAQPAVGEAIERKHERLRRARARLVAADKTR